MSGEPRVTLKMIVNAVAWAFDVPAHMIAYNRRAKEYVTARQAVCWLARELTPLSMPEIGRRLGDRDHTTILHAIGRAQGRLDTDDDFAERVGQARQMVMRTSGGDKRWRDADPVEAASRVMDGVAPREAGRLSIDEIVAVAARLLDLEDVAATTYQLLAQLDELARLRSRAFDSEARLRMAQLAASSAALSDALADALQGLGYEYAEPPEPDQETAREHADPQP
ncbi:hypothetical protein CCR97_04260 [Rhodoplanes elegans]|uniref:Chromosomal replication initiator DnaA C-terminal domain-containing protein n=1 Tax=Rhodoplanes elegans TaxID=29408 RepID=A0A327KGD9_9BRAD|nr:helix-turn-helix domain-containing protein [Rhodoplanes elegans]MBK5957423.1 hypothetical protein [Rhodoplanes elegans]RAI37477.1 hypothetical protein CH338_15990 [Rhodoplanes elegans]